MTKPDSHYADRATEMEANKSLADKLIEIRNRAIANGLNVISIDEINTLVHQQRSGATDAISTSTIVPIFAATSESAMKMESEMIDRELLELAAKAAGYTVYEEERFRYNQDGLLIYGGKDYSTYTKWWNPLTDDGDDARLEATLGLNVLWGERAVIVGGSMEYYADYDGDKQKARKYAGVRAAAEIGKEMK